MLVSELLNMEMVPRNLVFSDDQPSGWSEISEESESSFLVAQEEC